MDRKFANFFRSLEQFIGTVKVHITMSVTKYFFNLLLEVSTNQLEQFKRQLEQIIWMQKPTRKSWKIFVHIYVFLLRLKNASHGMQFGVP